MFDRHWNQKPPLGTPVNTEHPLWSYADLCLPFLEGTGPATGEYVHGIPPTSLGTTPPVWKAGALGGLAPAFPSTTGGWTIAGAGQYTNQNFTLSFWINPASISPGWYIFSTGAYRTNGWALLNNGNGKLDFRFNTGTEFISNSSFAPNTWQHWVLVRRPGWVDIYLNGRLDFTYWGNTTTAAGNGSLWINCYANGALGPNLSGPFALDNVAFFRGVSFNAAQVADLYARPWQLFYRRPSMAGVSSITPTIAATPSTLYANGASQSLALVGFDLSWTPGNATTFAISGQPSGVSITSQSVSDPTHASVTIATGLATGSLSLTDGIAIANIPVQPISFTVTPSMLPANHAGPIAVTLSGIGTRWVPGKTTFALISPPGGTSVVGQSVNSATSATLLVTTGSATGTLMVSDGSVLATVSAAAAALTTTISTPPVATGNYAVSLVGTNTVWTQETASSLFSVSGIAGASLSSVQVVSDTRATAVLSLGSQQSAGTVTITDTSTGAAASPIAVAAVPAGSVHVIGQVTLAHAGGTVGSFGGKTAAGIALYFEAGSVAGLGPVAGTTILDFATKPSGAAPLLAYKPAGNVLVLSAYGTGGTSQTFTATVPVQIGIGYHLLLSWSVAPAGTFTANTVASSYALSGIVGGTATLQVGDLVSGTGIPANTVIHAINSATSITLSSACSSSNTGITISVTRGTQVLYLNGVPVATADVPYGTYAYAGVQVGGNAGSGIALDHRLSNLACWNAYAPRQADALSLAGGAAPTSVDIPAYWFPMAGGTTGTAPTLADTGMADLTGNGNTLALAAGSLSSLTYAATISPSSPVLLSAEVTKCGKLAVFGTTGAAAATNGGHPVAPITAIPGTPTIRRNGTPVAIGAPTWLPTTKDSPFVAYLLQCGGVRNVAIEAGGSNYSASPTAAWSGGGGSGLVLGAPVVQSGVTAYSWANSSTAYAQPPTVTISDLAGTGTGALAYAVTYNGVVTDVVVTNGGTGYGSPVVTFSGGTSNGGTITQAAGYATFSGGVITGVTLTSQGGNYSSQPAVSVAIPTTNTSGPNSSIRARCVATVYGADAASWGGTPGTLRSISPLGGGLAGCGSGYSAATPPTFTIGSGSGCQLAATLNTTTGAITAINIANPYWNWVGSGYPSTVNLNIWDPTGTGAVATATVSNGNIVSAHVSTPGTGYTNPVFTIAGSGNTTAIIPTISNYISDVPIDAAGSGFTSPPTITISDATGSGAVITPIMTGVLSSDVMTYDAPAAWLTPTIGGNPLGGIPAVSGAPMDNWTGRREGVSGGLGAFAQTPTLIAGANVGEQPATPGYAQFTGKNRYHQGSGWTSSNTALTCTVNGTQTTYTSFSSPVPGLPVSWTNPGGTILYRWCQGPLGNNPLDSMGWAGSFGQWTLQYDDPNVNTPAAMWVNLSGGGSSSVLNLSGPNVNTTTPIVVAAADITISGNAITAIGLASTTTGTGWQGVLVRISGGGGSGACYTGQVSGGVITGLTKVCGGVGYTSTPTVSIYGTTVSGTTIRAIPVLEPGTNPTTWQVNAGLVVASPAGAGGLGYWTLSGIPWVVAPDPATGLAVASIDTSKPLATDDGILGQLTSPSGKSIGVLRFMDVVQGYGDMSNYILPTDMIDPASEEWDAPRTIYATFKYARYYNTDPSNATYAWSSPRVYGSQAYFTQADTPFAITATTTAGSTAITGVSGTALMVGSSITGTGIPAGTYVARLSGSTGAILSAAATATGTAVTLTVTNPNYIALPAGDNGRYQGSPGASTTYIVAEFRSITPHGLTTGQRCFMYVATQASAIPVTNAVPFAPMIESGGTIFVTGPYTVAISMYQPTGMLPNIPYTNVPQTVASTTEVDLTAGGTIGGWSIWVQLPGGLASMPYEYAAQMVAQLPGCAYWLSIPTGASDALVAHIAQVTAQYLGPSSTVYLEYDNEIWNGGANPQPQYPAQVGNLLSYEPTGSPVLGYYPADGTTPLYDIYGGAALLGAHAYDAFETAWTAAGNSASSIRRVHGSWWNGYYRTQQIVELAQTYGIKVDHVAVAPYQILPSDLPIVTAFSAAGSPIGGAGSWPVDAMNDLFRYWMAYSWQVQDYWRGHAQACQLSGQPSATSGVTDTNATAHALLTPTTIQSISVGNGGSGYVNPIATVVGGGGGTASLTVHQTGGVVTGVTIVSSSGFTSVPTILITDPSGSMAAATATVSGGVPTVTIGNGGSGYANPQVTLSGGGGHYTSATVQQTGGVVTGVTIVGAAGYTSAPLIWIYDKTGSGASVSASLTATSVASIAVSYGGVGYAANATVALSGGGGTGSTGWVGNVSGGQVASITGGTAGSGYTSPPSVTIAGGGGLVGGPFYLQVAYTWVDGSGRETTIGTSRSNVGVQAGDIPAMIMPEWPPWAASMNVYATNQAPGAETLYMNVPRSQYGPGKTYPIGSKVPLAVALNPAAATPPATNLAAANVIAIPTTVCYEGGATQGTPGNVPFAAWIQADTLAHPSSRDLSWGWNAACQWGCQVLAGSGATLTNYYQLYYPVETGQVWALALSTAQPAGDGLAYAYTGATQVAVPPNRYATAQGGAGSDMHNHVGGTPGNTSPMLAGLRDWFDVSSPAATPPGTGTRRRRWFAGLSQSAARPAR